MKRRDFLKLAPMIGAMPISSFAQTNFPDKPIKTISPYAAGGGPDVQLRQVAPH
jgi:tripartite-type tricarboxylate transporter receptor subunit TctC